MNNMLKIFVGLFLIFSFLYGCGQKNDLQKAAGYIQESDTYYQKAIKEYEKLISKAKNPDKEYLELGKLYFNHGFLKLAQEALKKSNALEAKKILAISYFQSGDFADALEIFDKQEVCDDKGLYYYGLTCEKLNLFDKAVEIYKKIANFPKAKERIELIEKLALNVHIKDLDANIYKIISAAPGFWQYPQAGAIILLCDEKIEITSGGGQVSSLHYLIKILNERGKKNFSEIGISYDSTFEKVELEYARTIKPDGTITEVGSRHIRDVSKYLNFPLYSNARVRIISFPEIAEGAVIEYKVKIYRNQLINKKDFVINYSLQSSEPIIAANFSIITSKDKPLNIKTINEKYNSFDANLVPRVEREGPNLAYYWQFKNLPQIIPELKMPPDVEINPALLISTFSNWQDVYNWWWSLAKDKINSDEAIKEKVRQLVGDERDQENKLKIIYNFCAQKIRYVAIEYGQAGYEPHKAEDIFRYKYGDCKDQAVLLVSMLREAGFSAWLVLIPTKDCNNLNEDFPAVFFNHCIAALSFRNEIVFLDPTAETCSFGDLPSADQGRRVLIFNDDGYKICQTPLYQAKHNLLRQDLKIKINKDETIDARKDILSHGIYDQGQRHWLLYTQPELIQEALNEKIQETSIGAKLMDYKITNLDNLNLPLTLNYSFKGPEYWTAAGNLRILPQLSYLDSSVTAKEKRNFPVDFGVLDAKEINLTLEIPEGFVIKYLPENAVEDTPWYRFMSAYSYKADKIYFKQNFEEKKTVIEKEEYTQFKKSFERLAKKIKQRIVLEAKRK
ncbi:MAG: DUF3857 domain-containing protein [Candidatus Omnitrophota bacterium]|nr:DUF3857 domain-containing protein [Candidatus Omnitrophota bacterium]